MDFEVPATYQELQRGLRGFVDRELRPLEAGLDPASDLIPLQLRRWVRRRAAELGYYAADFPAELGGRGLPQLGMVLLREAAAATGCRLFSLVTWGSEGPTPILLSGTEQQRRDYLAPLIRAEKSRCLGLTEPGAGSDANAIRTTAVRDGSDWVLNGTKSFLANADEADFAIVFAVTDPERRQGRGITAFLVGRGTPGFRIARRRHGMLEEEAFFEIELEACRVSEECVVGGPDAVGLGFQLAMESFPVARLSLAAISNGIADFALRLGLDHARQRHAFGRPIGSNQYVQGYLVDSLVELKASRLLTYECAWRHDQGESVVEESSTAKLYATEMANRVVDRMIQVHGGAGWMRELPLERLYRLVRMYRIIDGTSEIQKWIIARTLGL